MYSFRLLDVVNAQTGDRIWWTWDADKSLEKNHIFHIAEEDRILNPLAKVPEEADGNYISIMLSW